MIDGSDDTCSSTLREVGAWWQVDLAEKTPIRSITIINRWCFDKSDQANCLARLSNSTLLLLDENGTIIETRSIGDTTGQVELEFSFSAHTISSSVEPDHPPTKQHNQIPTSVSSVGPVNVTSTNAECNPCESDPNARVACNTSAVKAASPLGPT